MYKKLVICVAFATLIFSQKLLIADCNPCPQQCCMNPSDRCYLENRFDISASFLWWKAEQPDLPCSFVNTDPNPDNGQNFGFIDYINFGWKPGFRVEGCWETNYDGWNLSTNYTWMENESHAHSGKMTNPEVGLFTQLSDFRGDHPPYPIFDTDVGTFTTVTFNLGLGTASAKWKMQYNMFDLQLGKPYLVSPKLALTPFIGGLGGWIKRDLKIIYSNEPFSDSSWHQHFISNYWGVGPRLGFNSDWKIGSGFEFFGNFASALLFGSNYGEKALCSVFVGAEPLVSRLQADLYRKHGKTRIVPAIQMMIGLGWNDCFNWNCHDYYIDLSAAWEVNYYWNFQNFLNNQAIQAAYVHPTSLELGGLTASATVGF